MSALPPLHQLDANALVSLDLLLTERSVTHAAKKQGVTQSAMSQTLRRLRDLFGDPLLVRAGAGMELTPRANSLREPLHRLLAELSRLLAEEPTFSPATSTRTVRIAATDYAAPLLLPQLCAKVSDTAPGVDLIVLGAASERPLEPLRNGTIDVVLGMMPPNLPGIATELLWTERFVVLVRKGHPLTRARDRLARFAEARHLLVSPGGGTRGRVDEMLEARGLGRRVVASVPFFLVAPAMVATSDLVLTVPRRTAEHVAAQMDVVALEPPIDMGTFDLRMAWSTRVDADPASRWLRDTIASVAKEHATE